MKPIVKRFLFLGTTLAVLHLGNSCSNNFQFNQDVGQFKSQSCLRDESTISDWSARNPKVGYLGQQKVSYLPHSEGWMIVDGDKIVPSKGDLPTQPVPEGISQGVGVQQGNTWPNGIVYYQISSNLTNPQRVMDAINHWNSLMDPTVLKLVPRNGQSDYIYFVPVTSGCAATVGYFQGAGPHTVELSNECGSGNVAHEIGHAVGLDHEQNRHDRDQWLSIAWDKVLAGFELNFQIENSYRDYHVYDFNSIMHYSLYAFSTDGSQTIIPKPSVASQLPPNLYIGQRKGLSYGDINSVRALYGAGTISAGSLPGTVALTASEGLFARYYNNISFDGSPTTRVDSSVNFNWGYNYPAIAISANNFSARWTGYLKPEVSGEYEFSVWTTDQIKFSFQGNELLNYNAYGQRRQVRSTKMSLVAGTRYNIRLDLIAADGPKQIQLEWTRPDGVTQTLPASMLSPETAETPSSCGNSVGVN